MKEHTYGAYPVVEGGMQVGDAIIPVGEASLGTEEVAVGVAVAVGEVVKTKVTISTSDGGPGVPLNQVWTRPSTTLSAQTTVGLPNRQLSQAKTRGDVPIVVKVFAISWEFLEY